MSDGVQKPYRLEMGMVQAFTKNGVKQPAVKVGNYNGQNVYEFTIKSLLTQKSDGSGPAYFDVTMWSADFADVGANVVEGAVVVVDGPFEQKQGTNGGVFNKITASRICITLPVAKLPRQQVQPAAAQVVQQVAAAVPAVPAPVAVAQPVAAVADAQTVPAAAPAQNTYTF